MEVPCGRQIAPKEAEVSKKRKEKKRQTAAKKTIKKDLLKRGGLLFSQRLNT